MRASMWRNALGYLQVPSWLMSPMRYIG